MLLAQPERFYGLCEPVLEVKVGCESVELHVARVLVVRTDAVLGMEISVEGGGFILIDGCIEFEVVLHITRFACVVGRA